MKVEMTSVGGAAPTPASSPTENIDRNRQKVASEPELADSEKLIAPEEVLTKIKALTDDGIYSVRFENDEQNKELVISLIDSDSGEVIRQIPPEEVLGVSDKLSDLRGSLLDTTT
ncbi:flagellar protein FlaG [Syntrophotalea carbinolica DSM 2380]|uniref:Flagellar protein FlaG n=1 Tax=Syntrophotalea carbinolica (strain DSM 2380 / NBRC 103641 / GraBd1) TaxID=338963 RepID=Q3A5J5_SYNC1|nr:flagellar protein FlaG [Syntrophotalea carbinolica]ABA88362.2 flagellar protein FlaG [Syntrophotalea carbinolica DSM 2380]